MVIKLHKRQEIKIDGKTYYFLMSNTHVEYCGLYPKYIRSRIRQLWIKNRNQFQLIKLYNYCKKQGVDWKIEFNKKGFLTRSNKSIEEQ